MNIKKDKYIVLEIIPTSANPKNGSIIQLSALKINGLELIDRFDYRLNDEKLPIPEMKSWISYDNNYFKYVDSEEEIMDCFKKWSEGLPILVIDNIYTDRYLNEIANKIDYIYKYLDLDYSTNLIDIIIKKYNLEPSKHIVDLMYEALMFHYN